MSAQPFASAGSTDRASSASDASSASPPAWAEGLQQAFVAALQSAGDQARSLRLDPARVADIQGRFGREYADLWSSLLGSSVQPIDVKDRRFAAESWRENRFSTYTAALYLLGARALLELVDAVQADVKTQQKIRFAVQQWVDAAAPSNIWALNPEAMQTAIQTHGESLRRGMDNLLADLRRGKITQTDEHEFEVGRNVATSEGAVVFENPWFQLIDYKPLVAQVHARPLLIVPPCINKFYILDLQPENSFVRFTVGQGQTVFLVSWRNPDASCGHVTWDDYLAQGAMKAIEVALAVSGADKVNAVGWCVGGTILSSALAVMRARGDESVASLTLLTTMLDFREPGDLGVFIDEQGVTQREQTIGQGGIYPGSELGFVFQTLRANDLIWPNVINNYLKGKSPEAFDLLYWNADATNLPGPMYAWYLRNMYLENNLREPGKLTMCETPLDLGDIDMPSYVLATQEDHIVPWRSAYQTTQLVSGKSQFVLGASGHIAGVINPASKNKRSYWTGGKQGDDAQAWLASATETPGSWWTHWIKWLAPNSGKPVASRKKLGSAKFKPIEPAPGRYVKVRAQVQAQ